MKANSTLRHWVLLILLVILVMASFTWWIIVFVHAASVLKVTDLIVMCVAPIIFLLFSFSFSFLRQSIKAQLSRNEFERQNDFLRQELHKEFQQLQHRKQLITLKEHEKSV